MVLHEALLTHTVEYVGTGLSNINLLYHAIATLPSRVQQGQSELLRSPQTSGSIANPVSRSWYGGTQSSIIPGLELTTRRIVHAFPIEWERVQRGPEAKLESNENVE